MNNNYSKITERDVVGVLLTATHLFNSCKIIAVKNIAIMLKTSKSRVKRHIKNLIRKGLVEYRSALINGNETYYGYGLTKRGIYYFRYDLLKSKEEHKELLMKALGLK